MTSKNLFFKLMREDIRRRLWAVTLLSLAWLFTFPVRVAMIPDGYNGYEYSPELLKSRIIARATEWFQIENAFVAFIMIVGAIVLGVSSFAYLHSRKKVDFYHSIPVRRELLFFVNFLDGIWIMLVPYVLSMLFGAAIAATFGVNMGMLMGSIVKSVCFHMTYFLLIYSTAVAAMMMTGNLFLGILGMAVFYGYMPAVSFLLESLYSAFFATYVSQNAFFKFARISPLAAYSEAFGMVSDASPAGFFEIMNAGRVPAAFLASAALMGIALFLYKKRPSEAAGKAMAFPISKTPIKVLLVIPLSLLSMLFFYSMRSHSMMWGIFGVVCGVVLSHCVIEILYHFDFRKLFAHAGHMAFCMVVSLLLFFAFFNDWFGYDSYLPEKEKIESTYMYSYYDTGWVDYGEYREWEKNPSQLVWRSDGRESYVKEHMKLTDTDTMLSLAQNGIRYMEEKDEAERSRDGDQKVVCTVGYRLNSGKTVVRRYYVPFSTGKADFVSILNSKEYKDGILPIMKQEPQEIFRMFVRMHEGDRSGDQETASEEQMEALLLAYRKDLEGLTTDVQEKENVIGMLGYIPVRGMTDRVKLEQDILNKKITTDLLEYARKNGYRYYQNQYPIYPSFTNTLNVLEQYGFDMEEREEVPYSQCEIRASVYDIEKLTGEQTQVFVKKADEIELRDDVTLTKDIDSNELIYLYDEPKEVGEIYSVLVPSDYAEMNPWRIYSYHLNIIMKDKWGVAANKSYHMCMDDVPAFMAADMGVLVHIE